jgi:hypothetical protein
VQANADEAWYPPWRSRRTKVIEGLCGVGKVDILPFAISSDDIDVMVMTRPQTSLPGKILWLADGLGEAFADFDEWLLATVDYNGREYERLLKKHGI